MLKCPVDADDHVEGVNKCMAEVQARLSLFSTDIGENMGTCSIEHLANLRNCHRARHTCDNLRTAKMIIVVE
jgi:hypothetical protein